MSRARIVHVIESLGRGGAERLLVDLLARLDRTRFEHHVLYLFPDHALRPEIEALGIDCECLELRSAWDWPRGWLRLRARLAALRPSVVHTTLQKADMYGRLAARSAGVPHVLSTLHECPYHEGVFVDNPGLNRGKYALIQWLDRTTARSINEALIVVSRATQRDVERYFAMPASRIHQIYSGVDFSALERIDPARVEAMRRRLGIPEGVVTLLSVARLVPQKGHRYLLEALAEVRRQGLDIRLLLRGDGPLRAELEARIRQSGLGGSVIWIDAYRRHDEIRHLMALSDVFVFPSLYEGLGIAPIEAMGLGLPCIASRVGPLPEVVPDGRGGLLVPPRDASALAEAIIALAGDPQRRRTMGQEARAHAHAIFDIRQTVARLEAVYDALLGRTVPVAASPRAAQEPALATSGSIP